VNTPPNADPDKTVRRSFGPSPTYLQLGAFAQRQNAENLKQLLQAHFSYPIHIQHHPGHGLFRVNIGPIDSTEASNRTIAQLKSLGYQAQVHRSDL
jgi:cell division septation protein DedD